VPLLAAEAELGVLLLPLGVGRPVATPGSASLFLVVAGQLVLDADVEQVGLVRAEVARVF
jgi:hypothetical protein